MVRWDTPYENGQTRRSRAMGFGRPAVDVIVPDHGVYLWGWYWPLRQSIGGQDTPLKHVDIAAWVGLSGDLVTAIDCDILMAMDAAYRSAAQEVAKENAALMSRGKK